MANKTKKPEQEKTKRKLAEYGLIWKVRNLIIDASVSTGAASSDVAKEIGKMLGRPGRRVK